MHTIDSSTSIFKFQNAIFINDFVNLQNEKKFNFKIDKLLKLLNNNLKIYQQKQFYFFKNNDILFEI